MLSRRSYNLNNLYSSERGYVSAVLALVLGVVISLGVSALVSYSKESMLESSFIRQATDQGLNIEAFLVETDKHIEILFDNSATNRFRFDRDEFAKAVLQATEATGGASVNWLWAPQVRSRERKAYEAEGRIFDLALGQVASSAEFFFPVSNILNSRASTLPLGTDLLRLPEGEQIERIKQEGRPLFSPVSSAFGAAYAYFIPVFSKVPEKVSAADREKMFSGVLIGTISLAQLIDKQLLKMESGRTRLVLLDRGLSGKEMVVGSFGRSLVNSAGELMVADLQQAAASKRYSKQLKLGNRELSLLIIPDNDGASSSEVASWIERIGLVITGLISLLLGIVSWGSRRERRNADELHSSIKLSGKQERDARVDLTEDRLSTMESVADPVSAIDTGGWEVVQPDGSVDKPQITNVIGAGVDNIKEATGAMAFLLGVNEPVSTEELLASTAALIKSPMKHGESSEEEEDETVI